MPKAIRTYTRTRVAAIIVTAALCVPLMAYLMHAGFEYGKKLVAQ